MTSNPQTTVYVAMSGGVDSSVAAALLKDQGHHVVGVFFKPWQPDNGLAFCNWQQDRQDALAVATKLGIEFKTWDFSKEYGEEVTRYMIESYRQGITPNPDIMCNKAIKFGIFLQKALAEGADKIATGHYARVRQNPDTNLYELSMAKDDNKDQTYFLCTLTQEQLQHCLFPIGDYTKPEIRKLAEKYGLITHDKKDSQGVCFVGQLTMKDFLAAYIQPQPGPVKLLETHEDIGSHDGVSYYTIGQRHGLDLKKDGGPYYVAKKDLENNTIYVTPHSASLDVQEISVVKLHWILPQKDSEITANIKIRYRGESIAGTITPDGTDTATIHFSQPVHAPSSGQSAVFYQDDLVLGSGVIA